MFVVGYKAIPYIIKYSIYRKWFAEVNWRSAHNTPVPATGGLIFILSIIPTLFWIEQLTDFILLSIAYIGLIVGWIDDRKDLKWYIKLLSQFVIAGLFFSLDYSVNNLHGLFGIYEVNSIVGYVLTMFLVATLMNALNLIDGVDGLAGMISLCFFAFFTFWFVVYGDMLLAVYSGSIAALIISFLCFNYSPAKVFWGDAGSLFLGAKCFSFYSCFFE